MKLSKKVVFLLLVSVITTSLFSACSKKSDTVSVNDKASSAQSSDNFSGYPIKTDKTLKIWANGLGLQKEYSSAEQSPFHSGLAKNTGVKLQWTWPAAGTDSNQAFNLMIASGDLPDIIYTRWGMVAGGPDGYINSKYIIKLNDILKQNAPNLYSYLLKNSDLNKDIMTDSGTYYAFPWFRGDKWLTVFNGPAARKDWMDELGVKTPETIADWDAMLRLFKDKKGAVLSFAAGGDNEALIGAFGMPRYYYQDNGKIKYGPAEKKYKDYLTVLNKWYKDGLLDKDFATIDSSGIQTKILNNKIGVYLTMGGGSISTYNPKLNAIDPKASMVGLPYPVLNKGDKIQISQMDAMYNGYGAAITTTCKDVELAARFLDYGYSKEGLMYWNFGTEGESYTMVNGNPVFTDKVTKYADGIDQALSKYIGTKGAGPSIQDIRMFKGKSSEYTIDAVNIWASNTEMSKHMLPMITPTADESQEISKIQNSIDTYVKEMYYKFILGAESLDKFDDYLDQLKKLNLNRAIDLKQAQLDRYNKR